MALKLLLADESITIRKVVTKIFNQDDHKVAAVDNQDEMLSAAKSLQPDIVLLSTDFPGIDLTRHISEVSSLAARPNGIILLGNRGNGIDPEASAKLGAGAFVYKPLDNRELQKAIDLVINGPESAADNAAGPATGTMTAPVVPQADGQTGNVDQRAKVLFDIFESYFNENMVTLTDSMTKTLIPKVAAELSSKIIENIEITELPKQILNMTRGIVNDLVPQIAERVISREIESIKEEAIRLIEADEESE